MMAYAFLLGRIILGGYFITAGVGHITGWAGMLGYSKSKGVPMPELGNAFAIACLILGGLGILLGVWVRVVVLLLVVFLLLASFLIHPYWKDTDPMARMGNRVNFMKNFGLIGALLMILMLTTIVWPYALAL